MVIMKFETLQKDMIAALKAHDKESKDAISTMVSAVKKAAIDSGTRDDIKEELVDTVLTKELRTAQEQLDTCPQNRTDLMAEYKFRRDVIAEYAPTLMSEEEIGTFLKDGFAELLSSGSKGEIMKQVMPKLKGKADGKLIGKVVDRLCRQEP